MRIVGAKNKGRYYVDGFVKSTRRERYDDIRFLVDTSQIFTVISIPDAIKNNIDYENLKVNKFKICDRHVDSHTYQDCELSLNNDEKPTEPYKIKLEMIPIPVKNALEPNLNISRLGLDVLQKFEISFNNDEMMLLKLRKTPKTP